MISIRASLAFFLAAAAVAAPALATPTHRKATSAHHSHSTGAAHHTSSRSASLKSTSAKSRKSSRSVHQKLHGQQGIDSTRATEIQQALIREHYLNGEPSGEWDSTTVAAMQKFQSDQGWQTKLMPDSRALKKLGLGPDYSNAINAQGSSFADPKSPAETPASQVAGFTAASGVNR